MNHIIPLLLVLFSTLTLLTHSAQAQQTAKRTDANKGNMGYLEYLPPGYGTDPAKRYPVLIFLHGRGERGDGSANALNLVKRHGPPKHIDNGHNMCFTVNGQQECFVVISPQLPTSNGSWGPHKVQDVLDHVLNGSDNYLIDPDRIYLTGLSLGGIGTYNYASHSLNATNVLAAIAPVAAQGTRSKACDISARAIPIWQFHGDQDRTVHYNSGLNMFNDIQNCTTPAPTAELIFTTYAGVGHNSWSRAYRTDNSLHTPNLYEWLLSKNLSNTMPPNAPSGLTGVSNLNTSVDLTWVDNASDETAFVVERQTGNAGFQPIATIASNTLSYIDNNLTPNTTYEYRIKAINNQISSTYSNVFSVTTLTQPVAGNQTAQWASSINRGYLEYLPADYATNPTQTYPAIIFLHGHGERGDGSPSALNLVKRHGPPKHIDNGHPMCFTVNGQQECFIVLSPQQTLNRHGWQGHELMPFVQYALSQYRIDPDRVYLTGLSMGGEATWRCAYSVENTPNYFAALAPVAGSGDYNAACTVAQNNTPVWGFHGDQDNQMSLHSGRRPINGMNACGANPQPIFTVYAGVGHNSWSRAYRTDNSLHTPNLYEWFLAQQRNQTTLPTAPNPPSNLATSNLTATSLDLIWADNASDELQFELERADAGAAFVALATLGANTTSYQDQGLTPNTSYDYRVRAINAAGASAYSNVVTVTTPAIQPPASWQGITWTDKVGVSEAANGTLTKTANYGWGNGGAASVETIPANMDGRVRTTINDVPAYNKSKTIGLSDINADAAQSSIQYGFELYGDNIAIYVNGSRYAYKGKYQLGDVLEIHRVGSDMEFYRNGSKIETIVLTSTPALLVDVAILHTNATIAGVQIQYGAAPSAAPKNASTIEAAETNVLLYPNPVQHTLQLQGLPKQTQRLRLVDGLGRTLQIYQAETDDLTHLRVEHLPTGLYWIQLLDVKGASLGIHPFTKQ